MRLIYCFAFVAGPIFIVANPQGMNVAQGSASVMQVPGQLEITPSDRSILYWDSFSIETGETTRFIQPSVDSIVVNKVLGADVSRLMGCLQANGQVYLVNPNGVLIGPNGRIDTGGFIAATMDMHFDDRLDMLSLHIEKSAMGDIVHLGAIATTNGPVALLARSVDIQGSIDAKGPEILLAPIENSQVYIRPDGYSLNEIREIVQLCNAERLAINIGQAIDATNIAVENGTIFLRASENIDIASTGSLNASQGSVFALAEQAFTCHGSVMAEEGQIHLFAQEISIPEGTIQTSGPSRGGEILIGGDQTRALAGRLYASQVSVDTDACIHADAWQSGPGGTVVLWANDTTSLHGEVTAKTLGTDGAGGFIEISGRNTLAITSSPSAYSASPFPGTLLLDPGSITINHGSTVGPPVYGDSYIQGLLGSQNVIISTASGSSGPETITIGTNVFISWSTYNLTFSAGQNIIVTSGSHFSVGNGSSLTLATTNPVGSQPAGGYDGILIEAITISGAGSVSITGVGGTNDSTTTCNGVNVTNGASISVNGTVTIAGYGGGSAVTGGNNDVGVVLNGVVVDSINNSVTIHGIGGTYTGFPYQANTGVSINQTSVSAGTNLSITGTPGGSVNNTYGVFVNASSFTSSSGVLDLTGSTIGVAGSISCFDTAGTSPIFISGDLILTADTTITCSGTTTFSSAITSLAGNHRLTITAQASTNPLFILNGNIGTSAIPLGYLEIDRSSSLFAAAIYADDISISLPSLGPVSIYASGNVSLTGPTLLGSLSIYSNGITIVEASGLHQDLLLNSSSTSYIFAYLGFSGSPMGNITINADGGCLFQSGGEVYADSINVTGTLSLGTGGASIFTSGDQTFTTFSNAQDLTLNSTSGSITFLGMGNVGVPLGNVSITAGNGTYFSNTIYANSIQITGAVQLQNASSIYTSGNQQFASIGGAQDLTLNSTSGSITFTGIGTSSVPLGNVALTAGDPTYGIAVNGSIYANTLTLNSLCTSATGISITTSANSFSVNHTLTSSGNCAITANGIACNSMLTAAGNLTLTSSSAISVGDNTHCTSSGTGTIAMTASGNISIGNSALVQIANGDITLLAGTNITSGTSSTVQTTSASGNITIVCDNNNPTPPSVGSGYLSFGSGTILCTNNCLGGGKVLLYTTKPGVNTFPSTINATSYTPGSYNTVTGLYVPGTNEYVGYWYNVPPYPPDPPFEVIYKSAPSNPPIVSPTTHQQIQVATIQSTTTTTTTVTNLNMSVSAGQSSPTPSQSCKGTPAISIRTGG